MVKGLPWRNAGLPPERRIEFRVGIHLGDVVEESDGDLMGDNTVTRGRVQGIRLTRSGDCKSAQSKIKATSAGEPATRALQNPNQCRIFNYPSLPRNPDSTLI